MALDSIHREAEELNAVLAKEAPAIFSLLSPYGRGIYFPKKGVIQQTLEGKAAEINATIGIAREEDGSLMALNAFVGQFPALQKEKAMGYAPSAGFSDLRELWKKEILRKNISLKTNPANITLPIVVSGLTDGLKLTGELFLNPGENLTLAGPCWENYQFAYFHGKLDEFPLFARGTLNLGGLEDKLKGENGVRKIMLNFPHNPTGYTPSDQEMASLTGIIKDCAGRNNAVMAICDDAYFGLCYDSFRESIFSKLAGLDERVLAVKIDGISKEYYAWGLRIGFVTYGFRGMSNAASQVLENKTMAAMRGSKSCASSLGQEATIAVLQHPDVERQKEEKFQMLKERHDMIKGLFGQASHYREFFEAPPFNSGYFMCVELKKHDAYDIRWRLLEQFKTAVVAINDSTLRIAYSSVRKEHLPTLFENLYAACRFADDFSTG